MGKNQNAREAEARRKYLEEARRREEEAQKKKNTRIWIIIVSVLAVIVAGVVLSVVLLWPHVPQMSDIDLSDVPFEQFEETDKVTDYVHLKVQYKTDAGEVKSGDIVMRLFPDVAPKSVKLFQKLVKNKTYDGLIFHRVIKDFMIQTGEFDTMYKTRDMGGETARGEYTANGFENNLSHLRGVVGMARTSISDLSSGGFYIVHNDYHDIDGYYTTFGYVVCGMEHVDGIANMETETKLIQGYSRDDVPVNQAVILSATFVKRK